MLFKLIVPVVSLPIAVVPVVPALPASPIVLEKVIVPDPADALIDKAPSALAAPTVLPVSYTHLTLPTILRV